MAARSLTLTKIERHVDVALLIAALAVVPVIIVEQSHASQSAKSAAEVANWLIWILFAAEAVLMLGFSADRRAALLTVAVPTDRVEPWVRARLCRRGQAESR